MFVDLPIKRLTQRDEVSALFSSSRCFLNRRVEPELHPIKKVESTPVDHVVPGRLIFGAEEYGGRKDSSEALNDPLIMVAIWRQIEEVQHLRGGLKSDRAALLPERQSSDPYRDEPVLAKGQSELRVADDIEKELAAMPRMCELPGGRPTQRKPAKNKRTCVVGKVLPSALSLLADEHHGLNFLEAALCDADGGKERADGLRIGGCASGPDRAIRSIQRRNVPELFQNPTYLAGKGFCSERKQSPGMNVRS